MPPPAGGGDDTTVQKLEFQAEFDPASLQKVTAETEALKNSQVEAAKATGEGIDKSNMEYDAKQRKRDEDALEKFHQNLKSREEKHVESLNALEAANERYYQGVENKEKFERTQRIIQQQREETEQKMQDAQEGAAGAPPQFASIGRSVLAGLGIGAGAFGLASLIGTLRQARESLRELRLESMQFSAITGFGGGEGSGAMAGLGLGAFASRTARENVGLVSRDQAVRLAGVLGRGGFGAGEITGVGGLGEEAVEAAAITGTPLEEVGRIFSMMRNKLEIDADKISDAFLDLKITADDLKVPFKEFMENTMQVAQQIKPFGGEIKDAEKLVAEFAKELRDGTVTLSQVAKLALGGFSGAQEGPMAFLAQELMLTGPPELQKILSGAGGPLGQTEALRQVFRGERGAGVQEAAIRAGTGVVGGMVGQVGGEGATEETTIALQRRLFQMFGIDLPDSIKGVTEVMAFLKRGVANQIDVQKDREDVEKEFVDHMKNLRDEAGGLAATFAVVSREFWETILDPFGAAERASAGLTPERFQDVEQGMIRKQAMLTGGLGPGGKLIGTPQVGASFFERAATAAGTTDRPIGDFLTDVQQRAGGGVSIQLGDIRVDVRDLESVMQNLEGQTLVAVKDWARKEGFMNLQTNR